MRLLRPTVGGTRSLGDIWRWAHQRDASEHGEGIQATFDVATPARSHENCEALPCLVPPEGAIILLDVLDVECDRCGRRGRHHLRRLIQRYGIETKVFEWSDEIMADRRRKQAPTLNDQCGARSSNLPRVAYYFQWVN
jgi:hypothetical protein